MALFTSEWRQRLQPASYNGAGFFVDGNSRAGGRRIALHEFPKKDVPYAEDMGRKARRFTVAGYVIGGNYADLRDALITELERETNGILVLPTHLSDDPRTCVCDTYSVSERREQGGYAVFEIAFIEAGQDISIAQNVDTQGAVGSAADNGAQGFPTGVVQRGDDLPNISQSHNP